MDQAGPESSAPRPHKKRVVWTETHGTGRVTMEVKTGVTWPQAQSQDLTPRSGGKAGKTLRSLRGCGTIVSDSGERRASWCPKRPAQ